MSEIKEISIKDSLVPISIKQTEIILDQMKNCVCKIHKGSINGTGYFLQASYNNQLLRLLITNNHVLNEQDINPGNTIVMSLNNEQIFKEIKIDSNRKKYTNKDLDVTIIEIKDEDNIQNFLFLDDKIMSNDINNYNTIYEKESLYILNYINGIDIKTSYGILNNINENKIIHKCNTDTGSSGSPILLLKNNKVIGVHYGGAKHNNNFNFGTLLKKPLLEYIKENIKLNYIISEINIKEEDINKNIRIINSFEEVNRSKEFNIFKESMRMYFNVNIIEKKDYYLYENEKEIKENCKIRINNNNINFNYFYKFKKKGIYTIEYIFTSNLAKTDFMFAECSSLTKIDLSNFNSPSVTNMSFMFSGCSSLTKLDLSNFNTQNVTNMSGMFLVCLSLKNINLSNFNTQSVINMSYMFFKCKSLTDINLSNINAQSVTNMICMFFGCQSLTKLDLSNFNAQSVTNMSCMFSECKSLKNINLSNFNTQSVTNMNFMFGGCSSLKKENIITKDEKILNEF